MAASVAGAHGDRIPTRHTGGDVTHGEHERLNAKQIQNTR